MRIKRKRLSLSCFIASGLLVAGGCTSVGQYSHGHAKTAAVSPPAGSLAVASSESTETSDSSSDLDSSLINTVAYHLDGDGDSTKGTASDSIPSVSDSGVEKLPKAVAAGQEAARGSLSLDFSTESEMNLGSLIPIRIAPDVSYTLADLEQLALNNNPSLTAASSLTNKSAGLRQQVGVRPNPTLGYFGQQIADRNTDQHGVFVEQEFVRGNKLALNRQVLAHTTSAQRWEMQSQRYRVLTDVRTRFYEAVAAQRQFEATVEFSQVARRGVQVAEDRREAEEGSLVELLQSQTLLSEITLAAEQAEVAYRGAWQDLAAIAGLDDPMPANLVTELPSTSITPSWDDRYAQILAESPELSVANALVCEKRALLSRQQVQMVPNVTAQLGAGYDRGTDNGMLNVQVSAPIPVWNKNSGNISAAYADYVQAIENVKRIEQAIKSRLARAAQDYDSALAAVRKYEQEIIPQAKKSLELSEEAYRAGELEFLQVLIVRRSFYESTIRQIAAQGQLAQAGARVDGLLLTGGLDSPTDYTDGDGIRGASFGGQ
ncbi:TolC family protein [Stieleria varia]|nr:TolC family protein [Stieleria varia]